MAVILTAEEIVKRYAIKPVVEKVSLTISDGERIGLVGVNGTGKSTLLKLLAGLEEADSGNVMRRNGAVVTMLPQIPDYSVSRTAEEQVLRDAPAGSGVPDPYEARAMLTRIGIPDPDVDVSTLSGGQKKRVALAAALMMPADILLLDEPTNHLDVETILWLEEKLAGWKGSLLMATHDRYFLDRVCNRIFEMDHGRLYIHEGNYATYLEEKAARLDMESAQARKRSAILRMEKAWMERGARARSTKQKARIERYEELSAMEGPKEEKKIAMSSASSRLGRTIIECENAGMTLGGHELLSSFNLAMTKRERMAVVGENGAGKTTFLRMLAGELQPTAGKVLHGETVKIGFLRQEPPAVDPELRVIDYIRDIGETVQTAEGRITASQMLERFLFPVEEQYTPVSRLSGGERRRLILAGVLMSAPNVLLLDEPTNDLDISALEVLEDYLEHFEGAVVAVSHDRYFLDRIAEKLCVLEAGTMKQYACSFSEYLDSRKAQVQEEKREGARALQREKQEHTRKLRMTWREQKEYEGIEERMDALSARIAELDAEVEKYASDYARLTGILEEKEKTEKELEAAEERWLYLQDLAERVAQQDEG